MGASLSGFDRFRNALQEAAARALERTHPEYVDTFQEVLRQTGDLSKALHAVENIPTGRGFAKWQPILTAILDTELAMDKVRSALKLLKVIPPVEVLDAFSMSEGAWIDYHLDAWFFRMDGLLEREKKLVSRVVRALVKPTNAQWKYIENTLLNSIKGLSEITGKVRDPLAHGGGAVEAIEEERLWQMAVLLRFHPDIRQLLDARVQYHDKWYEGLRQASIQALAEIERVSEELNHHIDWDKL